jgi:1-acyl-sn-glycerol-3-phosphate acyltransferase
MSNVFTTPFLTPFLRWLARAGLRLAGWRTHLTDAPEPPFVFIGAPHTSNWDFPLMLAAVLALEHDARWLGKDSLFRPPFGGLMRWLGGIPVDRSSPQNLVGSMAAFVKQNPDLILCVPPEGTRKKVGRWRTGFYYIALEAGIPIVMTVLDAEKRQIRILGHHTPAGDAEREIREIQGRYQGFRGLIPENSFELPD